MYTETIAIRLKQIRKELGLSQHYVAKETGIHQSKISRYESGEREPTMDDIGRLADFYDVSTDWLFGIGRKKEEEKVINKKEK